MKIFNKKNRGMVLIQAVIFAAVATLFIGGLTSWAMTIFKSVKQTNDRELAMQIAEAGVEYYRWHLAHEKQDFKDGTNQEGPYIHDYNDKDGVKIGQFSLEIVPPPTGSSLVTIRSTGKVLVNPSLKRVLEVKVAIPSWAKYAVAANDDMRFGEGTEVFGPIQSNKGIRFDGLAHNIVSSAMSKYNDPDHNGSQEFGVHTHIYPTDPLPPSSVPNRTDVFMTGRQFPVPAVDFDGITADMADMKTKAIQSGLYFALSGKEGYHVVLKTNGTFDLYKVLTQKAAPNGCNNGLGQNNWGTWSIDTEQFINNYNIPNNGVIFLSDHTWVDGAINGSRVTIVAGYFPDSASKRKNILLTKDLLYTNYSGTDSIALIAQDNVTIGFYSENDLRIDAALIAQNGRVGRFYYDGNNNKCGSYQLRDTITLFGLIATNGRYGFAYTDGTGYENRNLIYDAKLLYAPPPEFPLTSDQYQIISWQEIK